MNTTPCPSPNGTNFERLYIVRRPDRRIAMDAAIGSPQDPMDDGDLVGKIRELLAGKLEDGDIEALIRLIQPDAGPDAPQFTQDRRRPGMDAALQRHVNVGLARRARVEITDLLTRFPALAGARVVG